MYNTSELFNINMLVSRIVGESKKLVEILFVKKFCFKMYLISALKYKMEAKETFEVFLLEICKIFWEN